METEEVEMSDIARRHGARYPDGEGVMRFHWHPDGLAGRAERDEYYAARLLRHRDCHCRVATVDTSLMTVHTGSALGIVPTCPHGNPIEVLRDGKWESARLPPGRA